MVSGGLRHQSLVDYNPTTREQALANGHPLYIYAASKALAEKAVNELGAAHPDVNIAGSKPRRGVDS